MPSGLLALLDDVSLIARGAAASIDDVGAGVAKAGVKAVGVVVDDTAVTPGYATGFTPDRELPLIWKIAKGSLRNKLLILLPGALLLSWLLPFAITPILMLGGLFLCFEGSETVLEKLTGHGEADEEGDAPADDAAAFESRRVAGAVRTDLILSAEIMAISLGEVADLPIVPRAIALALVGVAITALVYGVVALLVKLDDIGLHLARKGRRENRPATRRVGHWLLYATPKLLDALGSIGTVAMLWVGGGILLHGSEELGWPWLANLVHHVEHALAGLAGPLGGVLGWIGYAACAALVGLAAGMFVISVIEPGKRLIGRK